MKEKSVIFVCGASARQVVSLAVSAGIECYAADLFCDFDTRKLARAAVKLERLENVSQVAKAFQYDHCVLTGGMENYPDIVAEICRELPCHDRIALAECRDPIVLQSIVHDSRELSRLGLSFPLTTRQRPIGGNDGEWLTKHTDRSGGLGVHSGAAACVAQNKANLVYQRRVTGELVSGLYLADGQTSTLLAVSHQWSGRSELGCAEFVYCGSISPCVLNDSHWRALSAAGNVFASRFGLRGVFGIDFIREGDRLWLLELNPRITASAEVCQKMLPLNIVEEHLRVMAGGELDVQGVPGYENRPSPEEWFGKAIVFNRFSQPIVITPEFHRQLRDWMEADVSPSGTASGLGDVPMPSSVFSPGSPVLTVMVSGKTLPAVETGMLQLADEVYQLIELSNSRISRLDWRDDHAVQSSR
jgi:predicted ATP-grasp superfamily ATP-dependent carboligase